ncbi:MAG: (Fe-S)-binding protein [Magnetovibrionaceae bacterium]
MKPKLDWSAYKDAGMGDAYADIPKHGGNFAKAVAACINSRLCEGEGKQLMCPSFKVSGNPNLSTGGRVRLLKAALSADDPMSGLSDAELIEAMDLCVACKGCKRECENNVDMALIKAEFRAQQAEREGLSRRAKLFAETPDWLARKPWLKALIRWRNGSRLIRGLGKTFLGLSPVRDLPEPAAKPFEPEAATPTSSEPVGEVVLLVDTFSRHFEPAIPRAAMQLLRRGGYAVQVAEAPEPEGRALCCGRTYLAQGMIDQARAEAGRLLGALRPHLEADRTVVGLEASCVLGLRDDAQALGLDPDLAALGKSVVMLEEFLAKEIVAKRLNLPFKQEGASEPLLIHGHCHQKAVGAMKSVRRVLKQVPGLEFQMIDAGCCGMAGSFGIEDEHADLSVKMAEQALMPALRDAPEAAVMANGFSCRQQIKSLGDDRPRHLAQVLLDRLEPLQS